MACLYCLSTRPLEEAYSDDLALTAANDIDEEETSARNPRSTAMEGKVTNDVILPFSNFDEPGS